MSDKLVTLPAKGKRYKKKSKGSLSKSQNTATQRAAVGHAVLSMIVERKRTGAVPSTIKRDIPYLLPTFDKKTQYLEIRLFFGPLTLSTVAATAYNTVQAIQASIFTNFTDMASVFDEYRIVKGSVNYCPTTHLMPTAWGASTGFAVAAIDYANSGVFSAQAAAQSHDSKKYFYSVAVPYQKHNQGYGVAKWDILPEKLPDQDWIITSTATTVFAYWKPYMEADNSPGTGENGHLFGWMDFQFRGLSA